MIKSLLGIIVFLVLSTSNVFSQMMLKEVSLEQQINNSALVVEGEVVSKKSFWYNNLIYTANRIAVFKVFKGEILKTIDVVTKGGVVGADVLIVSSAPRLRAKDKGVFVLQNTSIVEANDRAITKKFIPYGAAQGFYKYDIYSDIAVNPFNKKQGVSSSFYKEITSLTGKDYIEVLPFNTIDLNKLLNQKSSLAPTITSFSPTTATAGTKEQLTINGSGFGSVGTVSFSDANQGGLGYTDALETQIVSWSDTKIVVEIPSAAGTGKIRVSDAASTTVVSSGDLTISYSELNYEFDSGTGVRAYPLQHYDENGNGGYEWEMQTDFFNDTELPGAKASFERAMETWRCNTKINWTIANSATNIDVVARDDINIIRFDNGAELDDTVLGECSYWANYYSGCISGESYQFYVKELEIVFDDGTTTNTPWYFGTGDPGLSYDFESVAVHELGHGHLLGHVINTNAIMHYNLGTSEYIRVLSSDDIAAGNDIQNRSTTTSVCGVLDPMTDYAVSCNLSVEDKILKDTITIYPNPSNGKFYISSESYINLTKAVVYDLSGRIISELDISATSKTKTINLAGMSKGIYLINIYSDNSFVTKKLILE